MVHALLMLLLSAWPPDPPPGSEARGQVALHQFLPREADSAATRARLMLGISEFHLAWQRAWRESEKSRASTALVEGLAQRRTPFVFCRPDVAPELLVTRTLIKGDSLDFATYQHSLIRSRSTWFAVCPTWLMATSVLNAGDESRSLDGALIPASRSRIQELRATLLNQLDSAATTWPRDGWIAGFRTRFRIDQGDTALAIATAKSCQSEPWWCAALLGYTYSRHENIAQADKAFREMERLMPAAQKCKWEDVSELLPAVARRQYATMDCSERFAVNTRLWWLADPSFRTAGNDRWVEQQARRVRIALHRAAVQDERYVWSEKFGGDALAAMVSRYGWPTYTAWLGEAADQSQTLYLASHDSPRAAPHTTFEYTLDRVHTIPSWQTVMSPFAASEGSWFLSRDGQDGSVSTDWWPDEHFRSARRLVQLGDAQTVTLRRQSQIVIAGAVQLQHPAFTVATRTTAPASVNTRSAAPMPFDVMLLSSNGPNHVDSLAQTIAHSGSTVAIRGLINPGPTLVSIEASGAGRSLIDARVRFAVKPPAPLDSMKPREIALSEPVVIDLKDGKTDLSAPGEELLEYMLGNVQLNAQTRRIGLYWESYGLSAADTVDVSIRITSDAVLSAARRLGIAVNVASNPNRSIEQRWTEPDAQRGTRTLEGPVPVQMRTIALNLSQLEPGPYVIEVRTETRDGRTASAERRVVLKQ